jgi:hypothetical protein
MGRSVSRNNARCRSRTARDHKCWRHSQSEDGLRVTNSTIPHAGLGLFASRTFNKGEEVCRLEGKRRTRREVDKLSDYRNRFTTRIGRDGHTGITWYLDSYKPTSCYGRFINSYYHTHRGPNTYFVNARNSAQNHIRIVATKRVTPGTEFLTSYGGPGGWYSYNA